MHIYNSPSSDVVSFLQGALDGGLDIPHNEKRFVGYDAESKEYDAEKMRDYIFGKHVAEYMEGMEEEEPEKFRAHFKHYLDNEIEADADEIEGMYEKARRLPLSPLFSGFSLVPLVFRSFIVWVCVLGLCSCT